MTSSERLILYFISFTIYFAILAHIAQIDIRATNILSTMAEDKVEIFEFNDALAWLQGKIENKIKRF